MFKQCILISCLSFASVCSAQDIDAKYQAADSGANASGTRSISMGKYLEINKQKAVYFAVENGDISGGQKVLLSVTVEGNKINLAYAGCVGQESLGDKETKCQPKEAIGKKKYTFVISGKDLKLDWSDDKSDKVKFKRVKKFDIE